MKGGPAVDEGTCAISVTLWAQSTGKPRRRKSFRGEVTLPSWFDDVLELVCQAALGQVFIPDGSSSQFRCQETWPKDLAKRLVWTEMRSQ